MRKQNTNKDLKDQTKTFSQNCLHFFTAIPPAPKAVPEYIASAQIFVFQCLPNSKGILETQR